VSSAPGSPPAMRGGDTSRTLTSCCSAAIIPGTRASSVARDDSSSGTDSSAESESNRLVASGSRRRGSFASIRSTSTCRPTGSPGRSVRSGAGSAYRIFASAATKWGASKGGRPVRHSYSTHPNEKMSAQGGIWDWLEACSGAMYPGVPTTMLP
jgi:hypothetical protein